MVLIMLYSAVVSNGFKAAGITTAINDSRLTAVHVARVKIPLLDYF
jgi:hypothetical protein